MYHKSLLYVYDKVTGNFIRLQVYLVEFGFPKVKFSDQMRTELILAFLASWYCMYVQDSKFEKFYKNLPPVKLEE